jgi:hypothetical protein
LTFRFRLQLKIVTSLDIPCFHPAGKVIPETAVTRWIHGTELDFVPDNPVFSSFAEGYNTRFFG